jgi:hypothetical protein
MPNWTQNTIRVSGAPADIRAFLEAVKWQDEIFDFNRLIPMHQLLKHTASGSREFDSKKVEAWYVENPEAEWDKRIERPFTPEEEAALKDIGHQSWYSWSVGNWGTKWNACHAEVTEPFTVDEGYVEIRFDTAWSMPQPIADKVFEMFPNLEISWTWSDEDDGYTRRYSIERDTVTADEEDAA